MIKSIFAIILFLISMSHLKAQVPFYRYYIPPHKNHSLTNNLYKRGVLPKEAFPNKIIELDKKQFLIIQKTEKSSVRAFKILDENEKFYILCSEDVDMCNCGSGSFIYYKPKLKLQRIEKAFSFSMKRNLVSRLNQLDIPVPANYKDFKFCEILEQLN